MSDSSEHEVLLDVEKNSRGERLRVSIAEFKGKKLVHVRGWYPGDGDAYLPGKGIALRPAQLPQVIEALKLALSKGRQ